MIRSYQDFDKPYRRGLVLGLSLAELFLILLFLLLLTSMGLMAFVQEEIEKTNTEKQELQDSLDALSDGWGHQINTKEFTRLIKDAGERQKLIRENQELTDKLVIAQKKLNVAEPVLKILKKHNLQLSSIQSLLQGKDTLTEALAENAALIQQVKNKESKIIKINKTMDSLTDKGRDPPCWFRLVADTNSPDSKRQRDVKIFDVKIEDDGFIVIKHNNNKTPRPINVGNEESLPHYKDDFFNRKLTATEFKESFHSFFEAGEKNKIQPYKCVFTVDVYDNTAATNKGGYKQNVKVIKGLFVPYFETSQWPKN